MNYNQQLTWIFLFMKRTVLIFELITFQASYYHACMWIMKWGRGGVLSCVVVILAPATEPLVPEKQAMSRDRISQVKLTGCSYFPQHAAGLSWLMLQCLLMSWSHLSTLTAVLLTKPSSFVHRGNYLFIKWTIWWDSLSWTWNTRWLKLVLLQAALKVGLNRI